VRIQREHHVAKKPKKLKDLFHETLKDIYFAENKILKTLPKMAKAAQSRDLKAAFTKHERETKGQVRRLDRVFKMIGKPARGKTCAAIEGILAEGEEIIEEFSDTAALDAGLIAAAQAVEHYEITRYGTLKRWAEVLGMDDAVKLLDATLKEEAEAFTGFQHAGIEFIYMLTGEVVYRHGDKSYRLRPGDSILFDSGALHGPETLIKWPMTYLSIIVYPRKP